MWHLCVLEVDGDKCHEICASSVAAIDTNLARTEVVETLSVELTSTLGRSVELYERGGADSRWLLLYSHSK